MKITNLEPSRIDLRDIEYKPQPGPFPPSLDLKPDVFEVEDQGRDGSCTANAVVEACEFLEHEDLSRKFNYYGSRMLMAGNLGEGAQLRDALRAAYHYGLPLESDCEYNDLNTAPSAIAYATALSRKIKRYERLKWTFLDWANLRNTIKSALNEGMPVVIASVIGQQIYGLTGSWKTHEMTRCSTLENPFVGSHAIVIIGYDDESQHWLLQNSWGAGWGDGGFFGWRYDKMEEALGEAWVVRSFNNTYIEPAVATNTSSARIFLDGGGNDTITITNSGVSVFGSHGTQAVDIALGASDVTLNTNVNRIYLPLKADDYKYKQDGLSVSIYSQRKILEKQVEGGEQIIFSNGTATIKITGMNQISINDHMVPIGTPDIMKFNTIK